MGHKIEVYGTSPAIAITYTDKYGRTLETDRVPIPKGKSPSEVFLARLNEKLLEEEGSGIVRGGYYAPAR